MASDVIMPKMGYDMTEGTVLAWRKREGEAVERGEILAEIETGKVNLEIEAFDSGVLRKILVAEGETVDVGTPIAIIIGPGEEPVVEPGARPGIGTRSTEPEQARGRLRASPLARRLADARGVRLADVAGSGPGGRIVRDDVLAAAASQPAVAAPRAEAGADSPAHGPRRGHGPEYDLTESELTEPLSRIRQTIARRLGDSWSAAPHIFLTAAIDMTAALAMRKEVNEALAETGGVKVSVNDIIVKAVANALVRHPLMNVSWDAGRRVVHAGVHVGVAVSLDDGLITVVIPHADEKRLPSVAEQMAELSERARSGKLRPADMATQSTFTVTNLGMYGIDHFTAIINPPEAAILAVGSAVEKPVVVDDAVVVRTIMKVTLAADHRIVDGAAAAEFLSTTRRLLERPAGLLA